MNYKYHRPEGLGAGPSVEQVSAWINNNQFISTVSIGLLTNFVYDILKNLYSWFKTRKSKRDVIPVVELFLQFQDIKSRRVSARLKFRIDQLPNKKSLTNLVKIQTDYLYSSSEVDKECIICGEPIWSHVVYYEGRQNHEGPICNACLEKIANSK